MIKPTLQFGSATNSWSASPVHLVGRLVDKFLDHIEQMSRLVARAHADRPAYVKIQARVDQYPRSSGGWLDAPKEPGTVSNVSSPIEETTLAPKNHWLGGLVGAAALCASSWTTACAQQSAPQQAPPQQAPSQRDDPATSGAGPTSSAPGQLNYDPPKGGSVTTDSKGVTTTQPKSDAAKTNEAPADFGNDSVGTTPPK